MKTGDKIVFSILAVLVLFIAGIVGRGVGRYERVKEVRRLKLGLEIELKIKEAEIAAKKAEIDSLKKITKKNTAKKNKTKKVGTTGSGSVYAGDLPSDVPPECRNIVRYIPKPPEGYKAATPWIHAICEGGGNLSIDWMRLYVRINGKDSLVLCENYNGKIAGGLFNRFPRWYHNAQKYDPIPAEFTGGCAVLRLHKHPDKIWHLWGSPVASLPTGIDKVWMEARVYIRGGRTFVQAGFDYWDTAKSKHREGGIGKWKSGSGWQIIRVPG